MDVTLTRPTKNDHHHRQQQRPVHSTKFLEPKPWRRPVRSRRPSQTRYERWVLYRVRRRRRQHGPGPWPRTEKSRPVNGAVTKKKKNATALKEEEEEDNNDNDSCCGRSWPPESWCRAWKKAWAEPFSWTESLLPTIQSAIRMLVYLICSTRREKNRVSRSGKKTARNRSTALH